jgi:hypothetical protein
LILQGKSDAPGVFLKLRIGTFGSGLSVFFR